MNRRQFLATSPAFLAALAVSAKAAGALPVGFPDTAPLEDLYYNTRNAHYGELLWLYPGDKIPYGFEPFFHEAVSNPLNMLG